MRPPAGHSAALALCVVLTFTSCGAVSKRTLDEPAEAAIVALDGVERAMEARQQLRALRAAQSGPGDEMRFAREATTLGSSLSGSEAKAPDVPGLECLVCEDVVQTWRETYPCAGGLEPEWHAEVIKELPACRVVPNCGYLPERYRDACTSFRKSLRTEPLRVWEAIMDRVNPYEICSGRVSPGQCDPLTNPNGRRCFEALMSDNCRDDPFCEDAPVACSDQCYTCFWAVQAFPSFRETCRPTGAATNRNPAIPVPGTNYASADQVVLEGDSRAETEASMQIDSEAGSEANSEADSEAAPAPTLLIQLSAAPEDPHEVRGIGSPPLSSSENKEGRSAEALQEMCFDLWDEVSMDRKARYFTSFLTSLGTNDWDANTVCKCLGRCSYDSLEALRIMSQCTYEPNLARDLVLFPDLADELRKQKALETRLEGVKTG